MSSIYLQIAQEAIIRYENEAAINDLKFDRHSESICVEAFANGINRAGKVFWQNPQETVLIPNWHRVTASLPDIFEKLEEAIKLDKQKS